MFQIWRSITLRLPAATSALFGRNLIRQLCTRDRGGIRTCTVDPNLEEQFVFPDHTDQDPQQEYLLHQPTAPRPPRNPQPPHQRQVRSLEHQLQVLRNGTQQEVDLDSLIQFKDIDFPLHENLVVVKRKKKTGKGKHRVFGSPDLDEPVSDTCCSGCGALLHCTAAAAPGYLPSEKYKVLLREGGLSGATCQRCHLLTHHHKALNLQVSRDQYRAIVQQIRPCHALVLLIVDLLDLPDSIVPNLPELVGVNKHVVVLGNKIDLLPGDCPGYLPRIKRQLAQYCQEAGFGPQVTEVHLISAKTGYGIEALISSLQGSWKYKGDVYLVGSANAGKSTLFNTLLDSDFCKSKATDVIHKATISPWPGTTLNLLKFPIINPTPYRMFKRKERLNEAAQQMESELPLDELRRLRQFSRQSYLMGRVGRTFRSGFRSRSTEIQFDPDSLAFGENEEELTGRSLAVRYPRDPERRRCESESGLINSILSLLNGQEVRSVVPTQAIVPRTFVLKPGMSLFVGALARIDFLKVKTRGERTVGGSERMKDFPALVPQEFMLEGRGYLEAAADVKLSSAGWVAVTAVEGDQVLLRVHGPETAGFRLRTPPLLPHVVSLKGQRVRKSATYKVIKPFGLLDSGLTARGAEKLQVKKKTK
uniref:Nitric oxide associated 1 n=1 Tax=Echeneis naucrates TaxID=173247 RepID=A0A665U0W4_ECHNA